MYYTDTDGNESEMQVNNFDALAEALAFMATAEYARNPIGVDFDVDEFIRRVRSGEDEAATKKRPVIGQRLSRYEYSIYFQGIGGGGGGIGGRKINDAIRFERPATTLYMSQTQQST
jgi:hypothetical protein